MSGIGNSSTSQLFRAGMSLICVALAGCGTPQQRAIGDVVHGGGILGNGVPVYKGDISRKYRVLRKISRSELQIGGPYYHDFSTAAAWMAALGHDVGADAVIDFGYRDIPVKCASRLLTVCLDVREPAWFEAWGTAVVFAE